MRRRARVTETQSRCTLAHLVALPPLQKVPRRKHAKVVVAHLVVGEHERAPAARHRGVQPEQVVVVTCTAQRRGCMCTPLAHTATPVQRVHEPRGTAYTIPDASHFAHRRARSESASECTRFGERSPRLLPERERFSDGFVGLLTAGMSAASPRPSVARVTAPTAHAPS